MAGGNYAGQLALVEAFFETHGILAQLLLAGTSYETILTGPLPGAIAIGDVITISSAPNNSFELTATASALPGAESIEIEAFTPIQNFAPGSDLAYAIDPSTVTVDYYPGKGADKATLTYVPNQTGKDVIIRVCKGFYIINFNTTASSTVRAGSWTGAWTGAGSGQSYQPFSFSVSPKTV